MTNRTGSVGITFLWTYVRNGSEPATLLGSHKAPPPLNPRAESRDIMTSNGGRLTPDGTRVSLLETRAACCRNSNSQLGGQPCRSLAHSLSEWMSTKRPLP